MLLRGQNLVGYRNYADDVAREFVDLSCEAGINVFRTFDALNDYRNFEAVVERIKANGQHFQGTICYSLTERRMGGDVFNLDYYLDKAAELEDMGADSICVKDMAGIIAPYDAYELIKRAEKAMQGPHPSAQPLHLGHGLHVHAQGGRGRGGHHRLLPGAVALQNQPPGGGAHHRGPGGHPPRHRPGPGPDAGDGRALEKIAPKYRDYWMPNKMSPIDTGVLVHQVPGGMISNLVSQLKENNALDRLPEVYKEVAVARAELGTPPLVTPTSQIVGVQAVLNVLFGKYKLVTNEVKGLATACTARPPPAGPRGAQAKLLKGYPAARGSTWPPGRHSGARAGRGQGAGQGHPRRGQVRRDDRAIYDITGTQFVKIKRGVEPMPEAMKGKTGWRTPSARRSLRSS
jgi:pyruvate carboxylase subunit B